MVKTLLIDSNNDLSLNSLGNLTLASDQQAILQNCYTIARTQLKECIFAQKAGIPYNETIWTSTKFVAVFVSYLTNALLQVQGVKSADNLTINIEKDILKYSVDIVTDSNITMQLTSGVTQ